MYQNLQPRETFRKEKGDENGGLLFILWSYVVKTYHLSSSPCILGDQNGNEKIHYDWAHLLPYSMWHIYQFFSKDIHIQWY